MHKKLFFLFAISTLLTACGGGSTTPKSANVAQAPNATMQRLLDLTNAARAQPRHCKGPNDAKHPDGNYAAAKPLTWNTQLAASAQAYASQIAVNGHFSHVALDGTTMEQRDEAAGYTHWSALDENLAYGFDNTADGVAQAVTRWLTSEEGHCQAMMDPNVSDFGAGYASSTTDSNGQYWVAEFGHQKW